MWTIQYDPDEREFRLFENGTDTGLILLFFGKDDISVLVQPGQEATYDCFRSDNGLKLGGDQVRWVNENLPETQCPSCAKKLRWFVHECNGRIDMYGCPEHDDECAECEGMF